MIVDVCYDSPTTGILSSQEYAANADVGLQSRTNENVDYCTL